MLQRWDGTSWIDQDCTLTKETLLCRCTDGTGRNLEIQLCGIGHVGPFSGMSDHVFGLEEVSSSSRHALSAADAQTAARWVTSIREAIGVAALTGTEMTKKEETETVAATKKEETEAVAPNSGEQATMFKNWAEELLVGVYLGDDTSVDAETAAALRASETARSLCEAAGEVYKVEQEESGQTGEGMGEDASGREAMVDPRRCGHCESEVGLTPPASGGSDMSAEQPDLVDATVSCGACDQVYCSEVCRRMGLPEHLPRCRERALASKR